MAILSRRDGYDAGVRIYSTDAEERQLLRQVRVQAAIDEMTISKWVADAIRAQLAREAGPLPPWAA